MEAADAERWVQSLAAFPVAELGSSRFTRQHATLEQLNVLSHRAAAANSEDFVLAALLTHQRMPVLLHALLAAEAWREHIFPCLVERLAQQTAAARGAGGGGDGRAAATAGQGCCMRVYFVLHHESVVCNLLESLLFHDYAATALGDGLIDLVDYCCRQVARLIFDQGRARARQERRARGAAAAAAAAATASTAVDLEREREEDEAAEDDESGFGGGGPLDSKAAAALLRSDEADPAWAARRQLRCWRARVAVHVGVTSATLLRYLAEHCARLPVGVMARLVDTHDAASLVVPLIENPPWVRRITRAAPAAAAAPAEVPAAAASATATAAPSVTVWQKYVDHRWEDCAARDLLRLSRLEAQPWLTLHALLLEPDCRRRYAFEGHRRAQAMRARKFLNEVLLDQLPVLAELQRFLDEATITGGGGGGGGGGGSAADASMQGRSLLLETAPAVHDGIVAEALTARDESEGEGGGEVEGEGCGGHVVAGAGSREGKGESSSSSSASASSSSSSALLASEESGGERGRRQRQQRRRWTWDELAAYVGRHALRPRVRRDAAAPRSSAALAAALAGGPDAWPDSEDDQDLKALAGVYHEDAFEEAALGAPRCAACGEPAEKRCAKCRNEWYCTRECQVASWKQHKAICLVVSRDIERQSQQ